MATCERDPCSFPVGQSWQRKKKLIIENIIICIICIIVLNLKQWCKVLGECYDFDRGATPKGRKSSSESCADDHEGVPSYGERSIVVNIRKESRSLTCSKASDIFRIFMCSRVDVSS